MLLRHVEVAVPVVEFIKSFVIQIESEIAMPKSSGQTS